MRSSGAVLRGLAGGYRMAMSPNIEFSRRQQSRTVTLPAEMMAKSWRRTGSALRQSTQAQTIRRSQAK